MARALEPIKKGIALLLLAAATGASAAPSWQDELAKMSLPEQASELNATNCARLLLTGFRRNPAVKALILMPGATDELYFFRRARATLTNAAPTLFDAIVALTNQTFIQATFSPPFLLIHTVEDPLEPLIAVSDERTADRIRRKYFEKRAVFNDRDWDFVQPILAFDLDTRVWPGRRSHDSHHFFRHSLAAFDLTGWEALQALALADKTTVTIERKRIVFRGDSRYRGLPPHLNDATPGNFRPAK